MSGNAPVFTHTLQQEIDDLRAQAMLLLPEKSAIVFSPAPTRWKSQ
jgi:hypothetical protein